MAQLKHVNIFLALWVATAAFAFLALITFITGPESIKPRVLEAFYTVFAITYILQIIWVINEIRLWVKGRWW